MLSTIKQKFTQKKALAGTATDTLQDGAAGPSRDPSNWYLMQAREFEKSKIEMSFRQVAVADRRFKVMAAITLAAILGMAALAILKRPNPPAVLRVDNATGKVDVLPTTAGRVTFGEKADRADLRKYVEMRESYDWETVQDMYNAVTLMSNDHEKDQYDQLVRSKSSPMAILKDQARVIAKVGVITFVGETAQVFFSKTLIPLNSGMQRPEPTYWVATISYRHDSIPEKTDAQDIDPTGFRVTSYTVDRDMSRAPASAQAQMPASMNGSQNAPGAIQ